MRIYVTTYYNDKIQEMSSDGPEANRFSCTKEKKNSVIESIDSIHQSITALEEYINRPVNQKLVQIQSMLQEVLLGPDYQEGKKL